MLTNYIIDRKKPLHMLHVLEREKKVERFVHINGLILNAKYNNAQQSDVMCNSEAKMAIVSLLSLKPKLC